MHNCRGAPTRAFNVLEVRVASIRNKEDSQANAAKDGVMTGLLYML
jgi:hypothetical protein